MFLCAKLTKLQRKENFDTNPDPDPEWLATVKRFQFDFYINLEGQQMLNSSWFQK